MTRTFEYQPYKGKSICVPFSHIKDHFKFLACSEDGHDAIEAAYKRHNLTSSDFKIALEFDDIVARTFRLFISVYEAGVETLYCDESNVRVIEHIDANSLSFSLTSDSFGTHLSESRRLFIEEWKDNHDEVACKALREYDEEAQAAESKYGRAFGYSRLMAEKALKYGATIEEMKKHWRCLDKK